MLKLALGIAGGCVMAAYGGPLVAVSAPLWGMFGSTVAVSPLTAAGVALATSTSIEAGKVLGATGARDVCLSADAAVSQLAGLCS